MPDGSWRFVGMPPGWHVTTGPGVLLFPAQAPALSDRFSLEAEIFLFAGESREPFGIFLGGRDVDSTGPAQYTAFVIRRDGRAAVLSYGAAGVQPIVDWQPHEAIVPHAGRGNPVKNVLRVDVEPKEIALRVNGAAVATAPRGGLGTSGTFGLRIGSGVNLHVSTLDITMRLAPPASGP